MPKNYIIEKYSGCTNCNLCRFRNNIVFGYGNINADIMFIGEAPGEQEDIQGIPFVGSAGTIFSQAIGENKLLRKNIYITNIVKCRPPKNRNPIEDEIKACFPFLLDEIKTVKPKMIICLGKVAGNCLNNVKMSVGKMRKLNGSILNQTIKVRNTYHPAATLYNPYYYQKLKNDIGLYVEEIYGKS
jgi:DNA polymerase